MRVRQKAIAPFSLRKVPANFCWTRNHAQISFSPVIRKGDREIIEKGQHLISSMQECVEQIMGFTLLAPSLGNDFG
jgi:hypothetical protein